MIVLSTTMEYSQLEYLVTCTTAAEMWTKLCAIYEQKSVSNKLTLTTKFHEYRMANNDPIAQHIAKVENMTNQLKDIDENVSDVMIMAKILGTLPSKCLHFGLGQRQRRRSDTPPSMRKTDTKGSPNDIDE